MNSKLLIENTATHLSYKEEQVEEVILKFWQKVKKIMNNFEYHTISIRNLGRFQANSKGLNKFLIAEEKNLIYYNRLKAEGKRPKRIDAAIERSLEKIKIYKELIIKWNSENV